MRMRATVVAGLCALPALALPAGAVADGVPPGVVMGGDGVALPQGELRYVSLAAGPRTAIVAVRRDGGRIVAGRTLAGAFGVPMVTVAGGTDGLSTDGRTLVVEQVRAGLPLRPRSRFVVLRVPSLRPLARLTIPGDVSFDALSPDGRTLFLIEHVAQGDASRYRVRRYDIGARRMHPRPIADPLRAAEDEMRGFPLARTTTADGAGVFTLYQQPSGRAFVHALDTRAATARCIFLPWSGRMDLGRVRMLIDGRGDLALVRARAVRVAHIDLRTNALRAAPDPEGSV